MPPETAPGQSTYALRLPIDAVLELLDAADGHLSADGAASLGSALWLAGALRTAPAVEGVATPVATAVVTRAVFDAADAGLVGRWEGRLHLTAAGRELAQEHGVAAGTDAKHALEHHLGRRRCDAGLVADGV